MRVDHVVLERIEIKKTSGEDNENEFRLLDTSEPGTRRLALGEDVSGALGPIEPFEKLLVCIGDR
jgi:hypothetical protein